MKLDPKIKSLSDILTCFDIEEAKQFIGQKGYFTDYFNLFDYVATLKYGVLEKVSNDDTPFKCDCWWGFFIPESRLINKIKKYRPFTNTKEFLMMRNFNVGDTIHIRSKTDNKEYHLMITGWTDEELMLGNLSSLSFNELLIQFELWDCEDNKFMPFGVEVD